MIIINNYKGYITLGSVIAVGAIALAVVLSMLVIGINSYEDSLYLERSIIAQSLSDSCAEIALNNIRLNGSYSGDETVEIGEDSCTIEPLIINQDGKIALNTTGSIKDVTRKTQVIVSGTSPSISIESWKEVADF